MAESLVIPTADYGQVSGNLGNGLTANWIVSRSSTKEVVYADTLSAIGKTNSVRFASSPVKNIYSGLAIAQDAQYPIKSGVSILIQMNEIATVTGTADGIDKSVPISAHLVMKIPDLNGVLMSNGDVQKLMQRLMHNVSRVSLDATPSVLVTISQGVGYLRRGILSY